MPSQSVYIDTELILFNFDKHDKGKTARATIMKTKKMVRNSEIQVKIPQVVLGELMLASCEGKCDSNSIVILLKELNADYPNANSEILEYSKILLDADNGYMQPNDAVIVAHVLKDDTATWFLTTDKDLIGNLTIDEKMDELHHRFTTAPSFR